MGYGSLWSDERNRMSIYTDGQYLSENPGWHEEDSPFKASQIIRAIDRTGIRFSQVAEVGCGAGGIVGALAERYPDAQFVGYEISADAHTLCAAHVHPNLRFVLGESSAVSEPFDLVLCCDVFEHVEDYLGFLRMVRDRARLVIFNIPLEINAIYVLLRRFDSSRKTFGHLHYFSRETALATLEHAGFEIVDSFLAPGGVVRAVRWDQKLLRLPRRFFNAFHPQLGCRLIGGSSLIAVARPHPERYIAKPQQT